MAILLGYVQRAAPLYLLQPSLFVGQVGKRAFRLEPAIGRGVMLGGEIQAGDSRAEGYNNLVGSEASPAGKMHGLSRRLDDGVEKTLQIAFGDFRQAGRDVEELAGTHPAFKFVD